VRTPNSAIHNPLTRRRTLQLAAAGVAVGTQGGWLRQLAGAAANDPKRKRSCIVLWMNGGPTHIDTFDPKPGEETGGPFKAIETAAPGVRIAEHLPQVARQMKHLAVVRSMATKEGDHARATHLLRTGRVPQEPIQYPTLGSLASKELGDPKSELPNYISITGRGTGAGFSSGYLGPDHAPLLVGDDTRASYMRGSVRDLAVQDINPAVGSARASERAKMLEELNGEFSAGREGQAVASVRSAYERGLRLVNGTASAAFHLDDEPEKLRAAYGLNPFGQGCLLARRLVEKGVPFVEVALGSGFGGTWDTHGNNFERVRALCGVLDPAWATLVADLKDRGLLGTTTVVWMGEFGRTPRINGNAGRDHYPNAWSVVLGGGGIKGGQAYGRTDKPGGTVVDRSAGVPDLLATICEAIGVDHSKQNVSNIGRPIRIVDKGAKPMSEVLA
jgi:uncharacterized protein (DUF1501 family)